MSSPATPKFAATLVIVREGPSGPEAVMGRRSHAHRFMPGCVVFPGGRVDPGDQNAPFDGPLNPRDKALLTRYVDASAPLAAPAAAIRETCEETSLLIGRPTEPPTSATRSWRPFVEAGLSPAVSALRLFARITTRPSLPLRFDTWFFLVRVEDVAPLAAPLHSDELVEVFWRPLSAPNLPDIHRATRRAMALALDALAQGSDHQPAWHRPDAQGGVDVTPLTP